MDDLAFQRDDSPPIRSGPADQKFELRKTPSENCGPRSLPRPERQFQPDTPGGGAARRRTAGANMILEQKKEAKNSIIARRHRHNRYHL